MGVMRDFNRDQLSFIERCRDEFGDVVWMRFLYVPAIFLYHPDQVEYVLVTNAKNFIKSMSLRSNFFQRLVGNGLLTSQGEEWKRQRRLSQPAFHRERVASYGQVMVDYTTRLTAKWNEGENRDIHRDMMRLTLEIVVQCLFSWLSLSLPKQRSVGFSIIVCRRPPTCAFTRWPERSIRSSTG